MAVHHFATDEDMGGTRVTDMGAQYVTRSDDKADLQLYDVLLKEGVLVPVVGEINGQRPGSVPENNFMCPNGFASMVEHLLMGRNAEEKPELHLERELSALNTVNNNSRWLATDASGATSEFDAVVLTQPFPQMLSLTGDVRAMLSPHVDALNAVSYSSRFAVVARYPSSAWAPLQRAFPWTSSYIRPASTAQTTPDIVASGTRAGVTCVNHLDMGRESEGRSGKVSSIALTSDSLVYVSVEQRKRGLAPFTPVDDLATAADDSDLSGSGIKSSGNRSGKGCGVDLSDDIDGPIMLLHSSIPWTLSRVSMLQQQQQQQQGAGGETDGSSFLAAQQAMTSFDFQDVKASMLQELDRVLNDDCGARVHPPQPHSFLTGGAKHGGCSSGKEDAGGEAGTGWSAVPLESQLLYWKYSQVRAPPAVPGAEDGALSVGGILRKDGGVPVRGVTGVSPPVHFLPRLILAGDGFTGSNFDNCVSSGKAAARKMLEGTAAVVRSAVPAPPCASARL